MPEYIECITKHRAKHFGCEFCNEHCWDDPCEPSDCEWMVAIESEPAADVVSRATFDQVMWERDVAMEQLKEHGILFGGKADVVAVVHGRWEHLEQGYFDLWRCTVCEDEWTFEYDPTDADTKVNYCPNCGAKMDGGE